MKKRVTRKLDHSKNRIGKNTNREMYKNKYITSFFVRERYVNDLKKGNAFGFCVLIVVKKLNNVAKNPNCSEDVLYQKTV